MFMKEEISVLAKNLLNLVYPLHCEICEKPLDVLAAYPVCAFCAGKIRKHPTPYCQNSSFCFEKAYSAYLYEGIMKELIHKFKYNKRRSLEPLLSSFLTDFVKENKDLLQDIDIITFVPLRYTRLSERAFNQSELLARGSSDKFGITLRDTLEKVKSTRPQNELTREERLKNLKGSFKVKWDPAGRSFLLIDDVMTTGATLDECARTLLDNGAKRVRCLTLARGL